MTAGAFDALGDATRRQILEVLAAGEQAAGAVVAAMQARMAISQPAVSQHLKVLRDAGLVTVRAEGTRRLYALDHDGLAAARAWIDRLVDPAGAFTPVLDALATEVARGKKARRDATAPVAKAPTSRRRPA